MTLDEELKKQLEESKRHNLNEFCGTCVRSSMCCDDCHYGPPSAGELARIALTHPDVLVREPLPVYLSPAVRT